MGEGGSEYKLSNCKMHVKSCVTVIDGIDLGYKLVHVNKIKFALKIQLCLLKKKLLYTYKSIGLIKYTFM